MRPYPRFNGAHPEVLAGAILGGATFGRGGHTAAAKKRLAKERDLP